ncbi:MAG TPA: hypothetical protein VMR81_02670 [Patescibacteria group bacterium]|jgi:hypothetical protein|nr:hypothetical protein [Patescibacteria group bacterium]
MTTVVNNPAPAADTGGNSFLIGIIVLIGFVMVLLFFGIPALRRMGPVQVNVPAPQVVVPSKLNVNVTQTK